MQVVETFWRCSTATVTPRVLTSRPALGARLLLAGMALGWTASSTRFIVEGERPSSRKPMPAGLSLSPDGRSLVFRGEVNSKRSLYLRDLESGETRAILGTANAGRAICHLTAGPVLLRGSRPLSGTECNGKLVTPSQSNAAEGLATLTAPRHPTLRSHAGVLSLRPPAPPPAPA